MSVFVDPQGIKIVHAGGIKKWQNSVHVVVVCPLSFIWPCLNKPAICWSLIENVYLLEYKKN